MDIGVVVSPTTPVSINLMNKRGGAPSSSRGVNPISPERKQLVDLAGRIPDPVDPRTTSQRIETAIAQEAIVPVATHYDVTTATTKEDVIAVAAQQ